MGTVTRDCCQDSWDAGHRPEGTGAAGSKVMIQGELSEQVLVLVSPILYINKVTYIYIQKLLLISQVP